MMERNTEFEIVIPVYNGGELFQECLDAILMQTAQAKRIVVIDSSSTDMSVIAAERAGCEVHTIPKSKFDHGGTRNFALGMIKSPLVVFITQDAILRDENSLASLLESFSLEGVAAVYGRQLPHDNADPIAMFAREKTYPEKSYYCEKDDAYPIGFGKCFMSNSFAAYDVKALRQIGGFPEKLILGEDSFATAKLLGEGYRVGYNAKALVKHSHNYTIAQEFRRYFDIGVFHETQSWMLSNFGSPDARGKDFATSQLKWLARSGMSHLIPRAVAILGAKFIGYKLGKKHRHMGEHFAQRFSMHKTYFSDSGVMNSEGQRR